jgi:hypothetical protein
MLTSIRSQLINSPHNNQYKQGMSLYSSVSQTPTGVTNKFQSMNLPPRADGSHTLVRSGNGSRKALRMQEYVNPHLQENQSTGSLRNHSKDIDETGSLFNYIPKASPSSKKSILYRMHNKPRKQLNILDGGSKPKGPQDV